MGLVCNSIRLENARAGCRGLASLRPIRRSPWVGFVVEFASNRQAGLGGRGADQFDDDAIADQRLARQFWLMDQNSDARSCSICWFAAADDGPRSRLRFIGEALQFKFPQSHARAVRSAAIGGDDQPPCERIASAADLLPASADHLNREGRRVVVDWIALHAPFAVGLLAAADQFLLLSVDGDRRLVLGHGCLDRVVDDAALRVPVGIVGTL